MAMGVGENPDRRSRIVLADDHAMVRVGLRAMLASASDLMIVAEADGGADALAACERLRPDLLITDLRMPGMNGDQLAALVKAQFPALPVLVLTISQDVEHLAGIRADAVLSKEAGRHDLLATIRRLLHEAAVPRCALASGW